MKDASAWTDLESKIGRVTAEVEALRKQNRKLSSRLKRLQREAPESSAVAESWQREKKQLRGRVERLVQTLESLL